MKTTNFVSILFLVLVTLPGFASRGAYCQEVDENGVIQDDGLRFEVRLLGNISEKIAWAKISDPGHQDIALSNSTYQNSKGNVKYTSAMNIHGTRDSFLKRKIFLNANFNPKSINKTWDGTIVIIYTDLKDPKNKLPVEKYKVGCTVK